MISLIKLCVTYLSYVSSVYSAVVNPSVQEILHPEVECCLWEVGDHDGNHEVPASAYMRHFRFVAWSKRVSLVRLKLMALQDRVAGGDNFSTYVARSKNHATFVSRLAERAGVCIDETVLDQEVQRICADNTYKCYGLSTEEVRQEMRSVFMEYALLVYLDAAMRQDAASMEYVADQIAQIRDRYTNQVFGIGEFYIPLDAMYSQDSAQAAMDKLVYAMRIGSAEAISSIAANHCYLHGPDLVFYAFDEMPQRLQRLLTQARQAGRLVPDLVIVDSDASGCWMYVVQAVTPAGQKPKIKEKLLVRKLAMERLHGLVGKYAAMCHLYYHDTARKLFRINLKNVQQRGA